VQVKEAESPNPTMHVVFGNSAKGKETESQISNT
jgi:hypothetical protein